MARKVACLLGIEGVVVIVLEDLELPHAHLTWAYCLRLPWAVFLDRRGIPGPLTRALPKRGRPAFATFEVVPRVVAIAVLVVASPLANIEPEILRDVVDVLEKLVERGPRLRFQSVKCLSSW